MRRNLKPTEISVVGPLASYSSGFCGELSALGYSWLSAANQLRLMAHLSRWLQERELGPAALTGEVTRAYLEDRRAAGYTCWLSPRGVAPLLEYLRSLGVAPAVGAQAPGTPLDEVIED